MTRQKVGAGHVGTYELLHKRSFIYESDNDNYRLLASLNAEILSQPLLAANDRKLK